MPTYTVTDPATKRTLKLTGDSPPTEAELVEIFAKTSPPVTPPQPAPRTGSAMPAIGEAVGGAIGGMTRGRVGAVIGGAAGRGYGELAAHAAEIPGAVLDVARNLIQQPVATIKGAAQGMAEGAMNAGLSGARQGALQLAGEGIAAAGGKAASWLMNRATSRVSVRLARDFPELSDTLIQNAISVSKGGEGKARTLLALAKNKATSALTAAEQSGATVPIQLTDDLAQSLKTVVIENAMKTGQARQGAGAVTVATERLSPQAKVLLNTIEQAHTTGSPLALTPTEADMFKTQLQRESRNLYLAMRGPNGTPAIEQAAALKAEFASRLNDAIDAVATGYKAANAEAKPLIGAVRGVQQAIRPNGNLYQAMVRPAVGAVLGEEAGRRSGINPIASGIAGAAVTSPAAMSREAILLAHPVMQGLLRQMPRSTAMALSSFLADQLPAWQSGRSPQAQGPTQ